MKESERPANVIIVEDAVILVTAKEVNEIRQSQFEKTVEHASKILCDGINVELMKLCNTKNPQTNAKCYSICTKSMIPGDYMLPSDLMGWRSIRTASDESGKALIEAIVESVKNYFHDWSVQHEYEVTFEDSYFSLDSKFKAKIPTIIAVDEFIDAWEVSRGKMIDFFVDTISSNIVLLNGNTSIPVKVKKVIYDCSSMQVDTIDAKSIYQEINDKICAYGWRVEFRDIEGVQPDAVVYPNVNYTIWLFSIKK